MAFLRLTPETVLCLHTLNKCMATQIYSQGKPLGCLYAGSRSQESYAQQGQKELTLLGMALEGKVELRTILRDRIPGLSASGVGWKQSSTNVLSFPRSLGSWEESSNGPSYWE